MASTKNAPAEQTQALLNRLKTINGQAVGGIQTLTIQDLNSQLTITAIDNKYLGAEAKRMANQKPISSLTQVVIPTVIRLSTKQTSAPKQTLLLLTPKEPLFIPKEPAPKPPAASFLPQNTNKTFHGGENQ